MAGRSSTTIRRAIETGAAHAAALALTLTLALSGCKGRAPNGFALMGATVLDGTDAAPRRDVVVVVREGRIESITPRDGFSLPRRTVAVDVSGQWIMPGLIDAHAHIARWALSRYLAYGVTTVRDMGGVLDTLLSLRRRADQAGAKSPRIFTAGAMLDGRPPTYADAIPVDEGADARRAVDRLAVAGSDYINVYSRIDAPILKAILDEAGSFRLRVTGHLGLIDALAAVRLGIQAIEHMTGVPEAASGDPAPLISAHYRGFWPGWTAFERSWAGLDSVALGRVAEELAVKKIYLVPTLVLHDTFSRLDDSAVTERAELHALPAAVQTAWDVRGMIARAGWSAADFAAFRRSRAMQNLFLREFRRAGGLVAAGTDASNQMLIPGLSEHEELELLVQAGLTPAEAITAATQTGAQLLGADSLGRLAPGQVADLVVLGADPLADIRNTRKIAWVMIRGELMAPDSLRARW